MKYTMGASHSVEATDTTIEDAIEDPDPEPEVDEEVEDEQDQSMSWFWPII